MVIDDLPFLYPRRLFVVLSPCRAEVNRGRTHLQTGGRAPRSFLPFEAALTSRSRDPCATSTSMAGRGRHYRRGRLLQGGEGGHEGR